MDDSGSLPPRESPLYDRLACLELEIERYAIERRSLAVSSGFTRVTTTVALTGGGVTGCGEDVGYEAADHDGYPEGLDIAGRRTLDDLSARLHGLDLFPIAPRRPADRYYRRWAFESAALDLALRQAGRPLGELLGLPYRAVRFVVSTRLEIDPWLEIDPQLEFKLDPTSEWTADRIHAAAQTSRVRALDFKGYYEGTEVDAPPDARLYREVAESFPDAILEDPAWNDATAAALAGHESRIAWDAPIHGVDDLERMPVAPRWLNVKPSRFGTLRRLCETLDVCRERSIACFGGGQFELGVGRTQIQGLASLFYPDAPNDVAPSAYNEPEPHPGLPGSPLIPAGRQEGFGFQFAAARR